MSNFVDLAWVEDKHQAAEDLRAARRYIEEHGWAQGTLEASDGRVCAVGSIQGILGVLHKDWYPEPIVRRHREANLTFSAYLAEVGEFALGVHNVAVWNDAGNRTKQDVVEALDKAAAWIEEQA